jgi:hypothetical protein
MIFIHPEAGAFMVPFLPAALLFCPALNSWIGGQLSPFIFLDLVGVAALFQRGHWAAGGALLSLLSLKPSLGVPLLVMIGLWLLRQKKWPAIAALFMGGLALAALGWMSDPGWMVKFLAAGQRKLQVSFGLTPNVWGLAMFITRSQLASLIIGGAVTLGCLGWFGKKMISSSNPLAIMGQTISLALFLTPFLWSYDLTLALFPIFAGAINLRKKLPFLAVSAVPVSFTALTLVFQALSYQTGLDSVNAFPSLAILIFCAYWTAGPYLRPVGATISSISR